MGATPTLPPHPQPPPISRNQRTRHPGTAGDQDLVLDVNQPPTTWPASPAEPDRDDELALKATAVRLHHQLAQADPAVRAAEEPKPLGRRLPAPLDATRQGMER